MSNKYEIVRETGYWGNYWEEAYAEPKEFSSFDDALKACEESIMFDKPEFTNIDRDNETASFIVNNRMRYAGDTFILRKTKH